MPSMKYSRYDPYWDVKIRPKHRVWGIDTDHKSGVRSLVSTSHPHKFMMPPVSIISAPVPDVKPSVAPMSWDSMVSVMDAMFFPPSAPKVTEKKIIVLSTHVIIEQLTLFTGSEMNKYPVSATNKKLMIKHLSLGGPREFWQQVAAINKGQKFDPYTPLPIVRFDNVRFTRICIEPAFDHPRACPCTSCTNNSGR